MKARCDNSLDRENVEFVSENTCEMVRMFLERTTGDAVRARDFGRNYIKHAIQWLVLASLMYGIALRYEQCVDHSFLARASDWHSGKLVASGMCICMYDE